MYLLENITVNRKEDKFFDEAEVPAELNEKFIGFKMKVEEQLGKHIFNKKLEIIRHKVVLEDGSWAMIIKTGYFKSAQAVEDYFNSYFDEYSRIDNDLHEATKLRKQWAKEHDTRTQMNIVDIKGNFVKTLNSCVQGICARNRDSIGGGCYVDAKCWEQHEEKTNESFHHIPISKILSRTKMTRK